jgi:hypothetical protein
MRKRHDDDNPDEESTHGFEEEEAEHDGTLETEADVTCPYCGEVVSINLDPGGGASQEYVQDCEVCCRPWRVQVQYDETGAAEVSVEEAR